MLVDADFDISPIDFNIDVIYRNFDMGVGDTTAYTGKVTSPVTVADRKQWFGRFSLTGPYRLFVARRGSEVLGYAASQPYREHQGFRETVEVSSPASGSPTC